MEIEGTVTMALGRQEGVSKAGNNWKKDEYVLETPGQYPHKVKFTIFGDRADQFKLEVGKNYVISCDIDSREFNGRWYTDVNVFSVRPAEGGQQMPADVPPMDIPASAPVSPAAPFEAPAGDSSDDLPF